MVWQGSQEDYLLKLSTPRLCVLVEDISSLPSTVTLPIPLYNGEEAEVVLEYEGLPMQCTICLGVDQTAPDCKNKPLRKNRLQGKPRKGGNAQQKEKMGQINGSKPGRNQETGPENNQPINVDSDEAEMMDASGDQPVLATQSHERGGDLTPASSSSSSDSVEQEALRMLEALCNTSNKMGTSQQGQTWQLVGKNNKVKKPNSLNAGTPGKKRNSSSTVLEESVWSTLNFTHTPSSGIRRLYIWPVVYIEGPGQRLRYLSLLQRELEAIKISLESNQNFTFEELKAKFWEQLQCALIRNIGSGAKPLITQGPGIRSTG